MKASIPSATISRLPVYLRCLDEFTATSTTCSSDQLAAIAGVNPAQVRKDLSYLGSYGVRGVGYQVEDLKAQIARALGLTKEYPVAIVGAGNLGSALAKYDGFSAWGFEVVALLDIDPERVGLEIDDHPVEPLSALEQIVEERDVSIGIVATPAPAAQEVADRMAAAGVRSILNFAPTVLHVPDGVQVRRVDLSTELQILTFHLHNV